MNVVIFGTGTMARVAYWYMSEDSDDEVCAFCVDGEYIESDELFGLPVVASEDILDRFPPGAASVLVCVGYRHVNQLRADLCERFKGLGYGLASYVSSRIQTCGPVEIGEHCFLQHGVFCQPDARIGNDVIIWSGAHIGSGSVIGDHAYISPNAAVGGTATIGAYSFLGLNASVRNGVSVAERCVVGAGAYVCRDTEPGAVIRPSRSECLAMSSSELREFQ